MLDWNWLNRNLPYVWQLLGIHVVMSLVPVVVALIIAVPIGYLVFRARAGANALLALMGLLYSIPSLALFVAMPIFLGTKILNPLNIAAALTVYTFALLVRSVVDGLRSVPEVVKQSAAAVGFGNFRRLVRVELPLAMPVIFAGLRVATVSNIALVSVGATIGMGGLGDLFALGFRSFFYTPVIVGLVLSVLLALAGDAVILLLQRGALPWRRAVRG